MVKRSILLLGITGAVVLTLISCDRNRNHPGWDYFPDMFYSFAYETYESNPNFEDGKTMRSPVEGTIPRDFIPFQYTLENGERERAGRELVNPLNVDEFVLERGEEAYNVFCANCHGENGDGNGYLYTSGKYLVKPRTIIGEPALGLQDGEIYHSITLGFGSMGAHGAQIKPVDRWKIISYIQEVLQDQAGGESLDDQ